ncbi:hypothetical protein AB0J94_27885 [Micromonospora noduli]|uniref:Transposase DDE domain-containing protein n=1 Tax=Micromonospora noduli TaxID=709876 RepID=A0ABX9DAX3_9ACTN|nr:hypothetical protein [Micromonospora noduli]RAO25195.1 hypothetical protein MED15_00958 [Micromonospora noduli]
MLVTGRPLGSTRLIVRRTRALLRWSPHLLEAFVEAIEAGAGR